MDGNRFDTIVRTLTIVKPRRAPLRALGASGLAATLARFVGLDEAAAAACKGFREDCNNDNDCCSRRCSGGECRCGRRGDDCRENRDCCGRRRCKRRPGGCGGKGCCNELGESCNRRCDCCGRDADCIGGLCARAV